MSELEAKLQRVPTGESAEAHLRFLTSEPHLAGTPGSKRVAEYFRDQLRSYGFEAELVRYDAIRAAKLKVACDPLHGCGAGYLDRALADQGIAVTAVRTHRDRGNVLIRQLTGSVRQRIVVGRTSPIQGWVSLDYASLRKAPVAEVIQRGRDVRYVTLIVPAVGRPQAEIVSFRLTDRGYDLRVRIGARTERVVADGASVSITD